MFSPQIVQRITKYIILSALTLSSECLAAVKTVQNWGDDDKIFIFTTRRPYIWEYTVPTYRPRSYGDSNDSDDTEDRTVFFIVLTFGIVFIALLIYLCKRNVENFERSTTRATYTVGATVHPPPRVLTSPTAPTSNTVAYDNTGYQRDRSAVDGRPTMDKPPDYATVTISDLSSTRRESPFPVVVPKLNETPPPKYLDGHPLK